jgi:hypothetical protein
MIEDYIDKIFVSTFIGLVIASPAFAHQHIRPGLWEVTTKSDLLALVPHIPSEHMRQLDNLASRYGLQLPKVENGVVISKICITSEMAQQEIPAYFYETQSGCTVKNATRIGNKYKMDLICVNQHFKGSGSAQGVFISPENFSGNTEFDSMVGNNPVYA